MNEVNKILQGDCLEVLKTLDSESVDCCITSPPYWGLRDYGKDVEAIWDGDVNCQHVWEVERTVRPNSSGGKTEWAKEKLAIKGVDNYSEYTDYNDRATYTNFCKKCNAWKGQLGLEPTPKLYVQHIVIVFREVKRVLKKEGTLWLDLGDSYSGSNSDKYSAINPDSLSAKAGHTLGGVSKGRGIVEGLKPKDLVGIPWRVAFALQIDGWYLRQDIIWHKPNPMPESVEDRCTKSHEYVFLLAKSQQYFFDNESIKETATGYDGRKDTFLKGSEKYANGFVPNQSAQTIAVRGHERWQKRKNDGTNYGGDGTGFQDHSGYSNLENPYVRNKRSVWTVATKPYSGAHFATFPEALIVPMIKAGTSEKGICPDCGRAWERMIEKINPVYNSKAISKKSQEVIKEYRGETSLDTSVFTTGLQYETKTLGWHPSCKCGKDPIPAVVLDPFSGAGTTAMVAKKLWRNYIGIELNPEYVRLAEKRIEMECGTLF